MEIPKMIILLSCIYHSYASEHSHTIPVENYETELQDLGSHVESQDTPAKIIKITKTIAVKIPVPYPVKVIEKVPYPVHIAKPYPVPVPQIVHVPKHDSQPQAPHQEHHQALDVTHGHQQQSNQEESPEENYGVQESHISPYSGNAGNFDYSRQFEEGSDDGHSAETPSVHHNFANTYQGYHGDSGNKGHDQAINQYLHHYQPNSNNFYH